MKNQEIKNYLKKFIHKDNKHKDELEKVIETELTDKLLMIAKNFVKDFEKTKHAVYITEIKIKDGVLYVKIESTLQFIF